jgi:energy-converting hydrogenase A subunit M
MVSTNNILKFPNKIENKKQKYELIRDKVEDLLHSISIDEKDVWAVAMAAGRFSSIYLSKSDSEESAIDFFKNCIDTQKKFEKSSDSSNIS